MQIYIQLGHNAASYIMALLMFGIDFITSQPGTTLWEFIRSDVSSADEPTYKFQSDKKRVQVRRKDVNNSGQTSYYNL